MLKPRFLRFRDGTFRRLYDAEGDEYIYWELDGDGTVLTPTAPTYLARVKKSEVELTNEPLAVVARALRNTLVLLSKPERETAMHYCQLHGIGASEILEFVYEKARDT